MGPRRSCPKPKGCGKQFTPRRGTRRVYCYNCRPEKLAPDPVDVPALPLIDGTCATAVLAELERAGMAGSVAGAVALRLARALDDPSLGAAQVASISDKLVKVMQPLTASAPRVPDELDEFTHRLNEKRASA